MHFNLSLQRRLSDGILTATLLWADGIYAGTLGDLSTNQPASTRKMAALIQTIRKQIKPEGNRFLSKEWAAIQKEQLTHLTDIDAAAKLAADLSVNLLDAGRKRGSPKDPGHH